MDADPPYFTDDQGRMFHRDPSGRHPYREALDGQWTNRFSDGPGRESQLEPSLGSEPANRPSTGSAGAPFTETAFDRLGDIGRRADAWSRNLKGVKAKKGTADFDVVGTGLTVAGAVLVVVSFLAGAAVGADTYGGRGVGAAVAICGTALGLLLVGVGRMIEYLHVGLRLMRDGQGGERN